MNTNKAKQIVNSLEWPDTWYKGYPAALETIVYQLLILGWKEEAIKEHLEAIIAVVRNEYGE